MAGVAAALGLAPVANVGESALGPATRGALELVREDAAAGGGGRLDGGDVPVIAGTERCSQLVPTDGMRAGVGTDVAEAQHIQGSSVLGRRRQTQHVASPLVTIEGVEQSTVQHRVERATQTHQLERVSHRELSLDAAVLGLLPGHRERGLSHVDAHHLQPQRGDVKSVLTGPAAHIENRANEPASGRQAHDRRLWPANVPGSGAVVV
jgi:hypothetical protein